jgi:hypothetical protein
MYVRLKTITLLTTLALCALFVVGCTSGDNRLSGSNDRQTRLVMNVLSVFYGEYLDSHQGMPPKDIESFRLYLESQSQELERYNVNDLDQIMTSPRDGQPLVIICGKRIAPADSPGSPWAAYEQVGVNNKKLMVRVRGGAHEFSAAEIDLIVGASSP